MPMKLRKMRYEGKKSIPTFHHKLLNLRVSRPFRVNEVSTRFKMFTLIILYLVTGKVVSLWIFYWEIIFSFAPTC